MNGLEALFGRIQGFFMYLRRWETDLGSRLHTKLEGAMNAWRNLWPMFQKTSENSVQTPEYVKAATIRPGVCMRRAHSFAGCCVADVAMLGGKGRREPFFHGGRLYLRILLQREGWETRIFSNSACTWEDCTGNLRSWSGGAVPIHKQWHGLGLQWGMIVFTGSSTFG